MELNKYIEERAEKDLAYITSRPHREQAAHDFRIGFRACLSLKLPQIFAEWMAKNRWLRYGKDEGMWYTNGSSLEIKTTDELWEIFINQYEPKG